MMLNTSTNLTEMKTRRIELSEAERAELEKGYRMGERHCFRMRCLTLLFKSEGLSSARVGERVGMNKRMIMSTESITAAKVAGFLDRLSFKPRTRNTVVALDNVSVHLCHTIKELRPVWDKRELLLFFLPPYSPHLNLAETSWRILKGKWIHPQDYEPTDSLFYANIRALASIGKLLFVNYSHHAA